MHNFTFCQIRVLPYSSEFSTYGYASIVIDCITTMNSSAGATTKRYYYHVNHLGSVIGISDNSGNVVQSYSYDSFGKAYIVSGSGNITLTSIDSTSNLYGNTRLFTWREYDRESSLYFNRARYYDPSIGRFISRDPIWQNDQVDLYTYVANSPVNYVDRMGREKQLLEDIKNGNKFAVSLVGRSLDPNILKSLWFMWTHTFIMIDSRNSKWITRTYSISGQNVNWKLVWKFDDSSDVIHWDGLFGGWSVKQAVDITTPNWMTDTQFAQNIYNGYVDYNTNHQVDYNFLSKPFWGNRSWNCNNFSSTILMGASGDDSFNTQKQIDTLDSPEADFWMWEVLY